MKLFDQFIGYEHKVWIKTHKLHLGVGGLAIALLAVIATLTITGNKSTFGVSTNISFKHTTANIKRQTVSKSASVTLSNNSAEPTPPPVKPGNSIASVAQVTSPSIANSSSTTISSSATSIQATAPTQTSPPSPPTIKQEFPNDYPAKWADVPLNSVVDTWGMDNRESVSYTAWKVYETFGDMPYGWGNANQWINNAIATGIPTGTIPKVDAVAIVPNAMSYGMSYWVDAVNGFQITVSSYNLDGTGNYNVETITPSSAFQYIYFK